MSIDIEPSAEQIYNHKIQLVDSYLAHFNGLKLNNTEQPPKEIRLRVNKDLLAQPKYQKQFPEYEWKIEYEGYLVEENYLSVGFNPEKNQIVTNYARLTHSDLKGKGISLQLRSIFAKNLPEGFKRFTEVSNERTKQQLLGIREKLVKGLNDGSVTEPQARKEVKDNYWIWQRLHLGYGKVEVKYKAGYLVSIVTSEKLKPGQEPVLDIDFDL